MTEEIISATPELTIFSADPLKLGDQFTVTVSLGEISGDLNSLTDPLEIWIASSEHFEFKDQRLKQLSADEIKQGLLEVYFLGEVKATNTSMPRIIAYFNYKGRPCGKVEKEVIVIAD